MKETYAGRVPSLRTYVAMGQVKQILTEIAQLALEDSPVVSFSVFRKIAYWKKQFDTRPQKIGFQGPSYVYELGLLKLNALEEAFGPHASAKMRDLLIGYQVHLQQLKTKEEAMR